MCRVGDMAFLSMSHLGVYGTGEQGVFDMAEECADTDDYPCLWQVHSPTQRTMVSLPDAHGILRPGREAKLRQLLKRISRAHYNVNLRLNSSSTVAVFTERPSIGVSSLSNVAFEDARHEIPFTLWCNSTLGLLCHWMHGGRQQAGRSKLSLTTLATLLTLDVRALTEAQLVGAERVFEALKYRRLLPFNECAEDEVRHELDRCLLSEVLGLTDASIIMFIDSLRKKLCAEPSIHGGKLSRCDFAKELQLLLKKGIPFPSWYLADSA